MRASWQRRSARSPPEHGPRLMRVAREPKSPANPHPKHLSCATRLSTLSAGAMTRPAAARRPLRAEDPRMGHSIAQSAWRRARRTACVTAPPLEPCPTPDSARYPRWTFNAGIHPLRLANACLRVAQQPENYAGRSPGGRASTSFLCRLKVLRPTPGKACVRSDRTRRRGTRCREVVPNCASRYPAFGGLEEAKQQLGVALEAASAPRTETSFPILALEVLELLGDGGIGPHGDHGAARDSQEQREWCG